MWIRFVTVLRERGNINALRMDTVAIVVVVVVVVGNKAVATTRSLLIKSEPRAIKYHRAARILPERGHFFLFRRFSSTPGTRGKKYPYS